MRSNKGRDTRPELALRRAVHALGLRYFVSEGRYLRFAAPLTWCSRGCVWLCSWMAAFGMGARSTTRSRRRMLHLGRQGATNS